MSEKIPVLIVTQTLDIGGVEKHLLQTMPRLDRGRFDISIAALSEGGALSEHFANSNMRVIRLSSRRPVGLLRLACLIAKRRPLLHCFLPAAYLLVAPIGLLFRARGIIMSRRSRNHYQKKYPLAAKIEHWLHHRMSLLLGNSKAVVDDLLSEGAPPERTKLIYNGIDTAPFSSKGVGARYRTRSVLGIPNNDIVIACVANLFDYKGHADLVDALALMGPGFLKQGWLLCIGRDAGERANLERRAAKFGLQARVHFLGERHDIPELLAASDIGVLVSHEEGFSNAILEGMAASLPMIVSNVGGNAEAVIHDECGYVVSAHAPTELAHSLQLLMSDPSLRQRMGQAGRDRIEKYFSIDTCVVEYEALYQQVWIKEKRRA